MINNKHRFHGHGSLRYVYTKGETERGPLLAVKYIENQRRDQYRLAVVVSKKVSKSAVGRNRIRRRLYEIVRRHEEAIPGPLDIVMTVFHDTIADMPAKQLESAVVAQLKHAGILVRKVGRNTLHKQ
jgi:ribonuclease P protein component